MKIYKVIIADDEQLTRERIADLLSGHPEFKVVAYAANGKETIHLSHIHNPDILFLDIKMPLASGFDVLNSIKRPPHLRLVFVTAYDHFAVKAFEEEAFDYLLKPFSKSRFEKVINRLKMQFSTLNPSPRSYILVKENQETFKVNTDDILYVESSNNYILLHLDSQSFKKRTTLSKTAELLAEGVFLRIHRSYILNINHIVKMRHVYHGDYLFTLSNGKVIPSSKSYRQNVSRILNK